MDGRWIGSHAREQPAVASATMFTVAATAGIILVLLGGPQRLMGAGGAALAGSAYGLAAVLSLGRSRVPAWGYHAAALLGVVLITAAVALADGTNSLLLAMLYAWVALFAFTFFSLRSALAHTLVGATAGAVSFLVRAPDIAVSLGVMVLATMLVCGGTTAWLMRKVRLLAQTDALTGLPNRRVLEQVLARERARATREGSPLAVAALDIDGFKAVNDRDGHASGDRLLQASVRAWARGLRVTDLLARYGGDEFLLVLPATDLGDAREVAERLLAATPEPLTCSAGVTVWDGREASETLLQRADRALYEAKEAGGARVVPAYPAIASYVEGLE